METIHTLLFLVYPYMILSVFVLGHLYRFLTDRYGWTIRSTEILEKEGTRLGITLFHWGMILTLAGHAGGMLIPQRVYDAVGIDGEAHTRMAVWGGLVIGAAAFAGVLLVMRRRLARPRVAAVTTGNHWLVLILLLTAIGTGMYNVLFGHFYVLDTIAPWARGIVFFMPDASLMLAVPLSYKIHILCALTLLGVSPFTRLVHIWSVPLGYLLRPYLPFRKPIGHVE
jgi:nitrate reductase gamma subunit